MNSSNLLNSYTMKDQIIKKYQHQLNLIIEDKHKMDAITKVEKKY